MSSSVRLGAVLPKKSFMQSPFTGGLLSISRLSYFLFFRLPQRELFRLGNSCAHSSRRATLKNVISASINIFNYTRGTNNSPVFRGLNCALAYSYTVGLVIFWAILYANSTLQKSRKFDRRSVTELLSIYDRSLGTEEFSRLFLKLFMTMQTAFS